MKKNYTSSCGGKSQKITGKSAENYLKVNKPKRNPNKKSFKPDKRG